MAKGVKHYSKAGKEFTGPTHKTRGQIMTGATHTSSSKPLFHLNELSTTSKAKVKKKVKT